MTIDKAKLKQLLSAQVSLHKVAKETGTIEDENVYLNADDALNEYLDDRGIYIEDVALALLAEIERLAKFEDWFIRLDQVAKCWRFWQMARVLDMNPQPDIHVAYADGCLVCGLWGGHFGLPCPQMKPMSSAGQPAGEGV